MKFLAILLLTVFVSSSMANTDETLKALNIETSSSSALREQVIKLTREKLALEIEVRKQRQEISDLNKVYLEEVQEKKQLEKDLKQLEIEMSLLEKKNETLDSENQVLKAILEKVKSAFHNKS